MYDWTIDMDTKNRDAQLRPQDGGFWLDNRTTAHDGRWVWWQSHPRELLPAHSVMSVEFSFLSVWPTGLITFRMNFRRRFWQWESFAFLKINVFLQNELRMTLAQIFLTASIILEVKCIFPKSEYTVIQEWVQNDLCFSSHLAIIPLRKLHLTSGMTLAFAYHFDTFSPLKCM